MTDLASQIRAGMATLIATRTATMLDACTVTRPGVTPQTPVLDADGNATPATGPTVYDGPCVFINPKLPPRRGMGGAGAPQEMSGSPEQRQVGGPDAMDLRTGDVVTATVSAFAPGIVGDTFVVVREEERSYATYRIYTLRGSAWQAPDA